MLKTELPVVVSKRPALNKFAMCNKRFNEVLHFMKQVQKLGIDGSPTEL